MLNCKNKGKKYKSGDFNIGVKKHYKYPKYESLEGCPQHITGEFTCYGNIITSLVGGPQIVDGEYWCDGNELTDLTGCASHIGDTLRFRNNRKITSLVGIHKIIKSCTYMYFDCDNITEGGIGLLMIENLTYISDGNPPFKIIQSYLGTGTKGMMECSKELTNKGYANYAKL